MIFADQADPATLRRQLLVRRGQIVADIRRGVAIADEYIDGGGPFRARLPIVSSALAMLWEQVLGEIRAVDRMLEILDTWSSTSAGPDPADVERMQEMRDRMMTELARMESLERIDPEA